MLRILITGGGGFIGSHLAERLIGGGNEVVVLDTNLQAGIAEVDCEKIRADVLDQQAVAAAVRGRDAVVHLAAVSRVVWGQERPRECVTTNVEGTASVLEAIRGTGGRCRFIFGSSREVYGESKEVLVREDHRKRPISIYGASKLASEHLVRTYCSAFEIPYAIVRFSNVYGSHRDIRERVIPKFVTIARAGSPMVCYGGHQTLDFTYIGDVVEGLVLLMKGLVENKKGVPREDFHFVTGKGTTVLQLARLIKRILRSESEIEIKDPHPFDVRRFVGDPSKARRRLAFYPPIDLRHGLEAYVRDLEQHGF